MLANSFGTGRAHAGRVLDQDRLDRWDVAYRRNQIIVEVLTAPGKKFLHQRHPQPLRDPALDLALDQSWIDGPADIVRGGNPQDFHRAQLHVYAHFGHLRSEAIYRVRNSLSVFVEL